MWGENKQGKISIMKMSCRLCEGKGRYLASDCKGCFGACSVMVYSPPKECTKCHGSGKIITDICDTCGGCGYTNIADVANM